MDAQGNAVEPEDFDDDRYYCKHGVFIGNPFGGDYMCGWCEDGVSWEDFVAYNESAARRIMRRNAARSWSDGLLPVQATPQGYLSVVVGTIIAMARW
jgi:hypothetical protein